MELQILRDSDTTENMPMFAQWKAANKTSSDSEVSSTIDKWQSASLSVSKMDLINSDTITSKMGDSGYPDLTIKIKRNYGSLTAPKSFWEGTTQKNVKLENEEDKQYISNVDDTYYYYMFPTMLNVTFEGKGADVCNASMIIPGISGTATFMMLGCYEFVLNLFSNPFYNINYTISFGVGLVIGIYLISKFIAFCLNKCKEKLYAIIIGFSLSSIGYLILNIIPFIKISNFIILIILFLIGYTISYFLEENSNFIYFFFIL